MESGAVQSDDRYHLAELMCLHMLSISCWSVVIVALVVGCHILWTLTSAPVLSLQCSWPSLVFIFVSQDCDFLSPSTCRDQWTGLSILLKRNLTPCHLVLFLALFNWFWKTVPSNSWQHIMLKGVGSSAATYSGKVVCFVTETTFLAICWELSRFVLAFTASAENCLTTAALRDINLRMSTHIFDLLLWGLFSLCYSYHCM